MLTLNKFVFFTSLLILSLIFIAIITFPDKNLHIVACDVGQGDAILVTHGENQVLIDGGPSRRVLDCLGRHIPFWDRQIEIVIITHPDKDHYGGILDVVENYNIGKIITPGLDSINEEWRVLESQVGRRGIGVVQAIEGQVIRVGMIYLDILAPTSKEIAAELEGAKPQHQSVEQNVLGSFVADDPNNLSIVAILDYGDFEALLTGDIEDAASDKIADKLMQKQIDFEYIKVPHHGSKNGLSEKLVKAINAEISVISAGKNNSYGHPHEEVLELLNDKKTKILRTDQIGDIKITTDGDKIWIR